MGALDDLLNEEEKKRKKPSQIAATEQNVKQGGALDALLVESKKPKPVQTKPVVTPKPVQTQQSNYFQDAVTSIAIPVKNLIDTALKQYLPQTRSQISELVKDPFSTKSNSLDPVQFLGKAGQDAWKTAVDTIKQSGPKINDYINTYHLVGLNINPISTPRVTPPSSKDIGKGLEAAAAVGNIVFSPISAIFAGANDIPGLGSVSRLITVPFTALGEGATKVSNKLVDTLPISQKAKDNIKPGLGEVFALASQLLLGKITEVGAKKTVELTKKYGKQDAETIVNKAQELAQEKQTAQNNSIELTPEQARTQVNATDLGGTSVGDALLKAADQAEKEGKSLLIAAPKTAGLLEAPKENYTSGKGFEMTDKVNKAKAGEMNAITDYNVAVDKFNKKPTPATLKRVQTAREVLKTPQGNSFTIDFVEPKKIQLLSEEGTPQQFTSNNEVPGIPVKSDIQPLPKQEAVLQKPIGDGQVKTSKVASSIDVKSIEKGLTKGFGELAGYESITIKDQSQRAAKLMGEDIEKAKRMVLGKEPMESGLKGEMLIKAMEDHAVIKGDIELLRNLAKSPLVSETSAHAQAMRILAERDPESPLKAMKDIADARVKAIEKRYGKKVNKVIDETIAKMKRSIPKVEKEDWASFIKSIEC